MKIIIYNQQLSSTLIFEDEETGEKMIRAINNCINNPDKYQSVQYHQDNKLNAIYPAIMLQNSIIKIEP